MKILLFTRCTRLWKKKKTLKCVITNFHVFIRKPVLQTCAEQLISSDEFDIGQNNWYEIYPDRHLDKFEQKAIRLFSVSYWSTFILRVMSRPPNISIQFIELSSLHKFYTLTNLYIPPGLWKIFKFMLFR